MLREETPPRVDAVSFHMARISVADESDDVFPVCPNNVGEGSKAQAEQIGDVLRAARSPARQLVRCLNKTGNIQQQDGRESNSRIDLSKPRRLSARTLLTHFGTYALTFTLRSRSIDVTSGHQ